MARGLRGDGPIAQSNLAGMGVGLVRVALFTGALFVISWTTVDPDLWGHLAFGRDIVQQGALTTSDQYSFTSDRPWINHEWLAEVLLFVAYDAGGTMGLVALKSVVVAAALIPMVLAVRRSRLELIHQDALIIAALVVMLSRFHPARPQVFSLLLFAILLQALVAADRGRRRWLTAVPFVFAAWANLHGGFIVGLGVLGIWIAVRVVQQAEGGSQGWLVLLGIASASATLINPYGFGLWRFLSSTVGLSRPDINDWQPLYSLPLPLAAPFIVAAVVSAAAMWRGRRRIDAAWLAIVAVLAIGAVRVSRLDAFFAIAMVILLAPTLGKEGRRPDERKARRPVRTLHRWVYAGLAAAVVGGGLVAAAEDARCLEIRDAPEPEATAFFQANQVRGRAVTFFNWGQYAIWHLAPAIQVSMDGRRETVYSDGLFASHVRLYRGDPQAVSLVDRLNPDFVWLPSQAPSLPALRARGWRVAFAGPVSTILARTGQEAEGPPPGQDAGVRCFPGP
jgi:hypothetical protein